jgi:hypothetical protein
MQFGKEYNSAVSVVEIFFFLEPPCCLFEIRIGKMREYIYL